jgi:hypothetical protein
MDSDSEINSNDISIIQNLIIEKYTFYISKENIDIISTDNIISLMIKLF